MPASFSLERKFLNYNIGCVWNALDAQILLFRSFHAFFIENGRMTIWPDISVLVKSLGRVIYQNIITRAVRLSNYQHIIAPTKQKTSRCECFKNKDIDTLSVNGQMVNCMTCVWANCHKRKLRDTECTDVVVQD